MNSLCAKFYIIKSSNINTANIVLFLAILHRTSLFYPKIAISISIQLQNVAIIGYVLNKIMNYHCVNFYTIASRNRNITNIFQCLATSAQILTILPNNITFFVKFSLASLVLSFIYVYELPLCKSLHHFILKYKEHKYFPIPRDFTQNLAILPWYGLIKSFVFIGRSYFHKNKKYEFACQLTEAIKNKRKDDAMEKNILLDLECIALSTNTKSRVRTNRKWKLAGNTNAYCVWVWPELTAGESS